MAAELNALIGKYLKLKDEWANAYQQLIALNNEADELIKQIQQVRNAGTEGGEEQTDALRILTMCCELEEAIRKDAVAKGQEWDLLSKQLRELLAEINTKRQRNLGS